MVVQDNWRFCSKCHGLTYNGLGSTACPEGGLHDLNNSSDYILMAYNDFPPG